MRRRAQATLVGALVGALLLPRSTRAHPPEHPGEAPPPGGGTFTATAAAAAALTLDAVPCLRFEPLPSVAAPRRAPWATGAPSGQGRLAARGALPPRPSTELPAERRPAGAEARPPEPAPGGTILVVGRSMVPGPLAALPAAGAVSSVLEKLVLAAQPGIPESAGSSRFDPAKISLHGGSVRWTRWSLDGFELSDPFFAGATLVHVPYDFLDALALDHREDAGSSGDDAVALSSGLESLPAGAHAEASVRGALPDAGGRFPGAEALTRTFSTTHPTDRTPAPPAERRRETDRLTLGLVRGARDRGDRLKYALELDRGTRRFLGFDPSGGLAAPFDEHALRLSGALGFAPAWPSEARVLAAAEYLRRDHLYAELRYGPRETARLERAALFGGLALGRLRVGLGLVGLVLTPNEPGFTRELLDPDGEALSPWYPGGRALGATLEARYTGTTLYVASLHRLLQHWPQEQRWTHALTYEGAPYGALALASAPTAALAGDERLGARGRTRAGPLELAWDVYGFAAWSAGSAGANALLLPDLGAKLTARLPSERLTPFVALAKTPVMPDAETLRALDPRWLDLRYTLADGTLIDRTGGGAITPEQGLRPANVLSAALGAAGAPWAGVQLEAQGLLRAFPGVWYLDLARGPAAEGGWVDGRWLFRPGEHPYALRNRALADTPLYAGLELALTLRPSEHLLLHAGFTAYFAVGKTALGSGPTANDLGVLDGSTANPNTAANALANLDGDRAFALKALLAWEPAPDLWLTASARHKDGRPFAFLDAALTDGQATFALASERGSPLVFTRPLAGPREDFQLELDVELAWTLRARGVALTGRVLAANLLDLGNELAERNTPVGRTTRAALELQLPRTVLLTLALAP